MCFTWQILESRISFSRSVSNVVGNFMKHILSNISKEKCNWWVNGLLSLIGSGKWSIFLCIVYQMSRKQKSVFMTTGQNKNGQSIWVTHCLNFYFGVFIWAFSENIVSEAIEEAKSRWEGTHRAENWRQSLPSLFSSNTLRALAPITSHLILDSRHGQAEPAYLRAHPTSTIVSIDSVVSLVFLDVILVLKWY